MKNKQNSLLTKILLVLMVMLVLIGGVSFAYASSLPTRIVATRDEEQSFLLADEVRDVVRIKQHPAIIVTDDLNTVSISAANYLSVQKDAPIIYIHQNNLDTVVEYIQKNLVQKGVLYLIGEETSTTLVLRERLSDVKTKRLYGEDVYSTNLDILRTSKVDDELIICSADSIIDNMTAATSGKPIMLVGGSLTTEQKIFLFFKRPDFFIVDSQKCVEQTVIDELSSFGEVTYLSGSDKYETSAKLATQFYPEATQAIVAHVNNITEAASLPLLGSTIQSPVLIVDTCKETYAEEYMQTRNITNGYVIGAENVLPKHTIDILFTDITPTGHEFEVDTYDATCTWYGYEQTYCKHCGIEKELTKLPPVAHEYKVLETVEVTTGWDGYELGECIHCKHVEKINIQPQLAPDEWPKGYQDETSKIVIYKEWYDNAYVYAAHLEFSDYSRLKTDGAYGKNNEGRETTSAAAERVEAIFMVNGDYAVPGNMANTYAIARNGVVFANGIIEAIGVYNNKTGILTSPDALGITGKRLNNEVEAGKLTDTFQFADAFLVDGVLLSNKASTSRAQRTFIGTNGNAGDIWVCVSDGRNNDGRSEGLTGHQCASFLKEKGCTFGIPLDGGGSSTIWFQGEVLNAAKDNQRAVADFLFFK